MCNILFYLVRNQKIGYALVFEKAKNKSKTFGTPSFGILKTQTESNQRNDKFEHFYFTALHFVKYTLSVTLDPFFPLELL